MPICPNGIRRISAAYRAIVMKKPGILLRYLRPSKKSRNRKITV